MSGFEKAARNKEINEGVGIEEGRGGVKLMFVRKWINFTKLGFGLVWGHKLLGDSWGIGVKGYRDKLGGQAYL